MKPYLSLLTLFRSTARTILTFVLLGVASFALFTQVSGYAITRRELNNAAALYRGVGAAEITPPYKPLSRKASALPYYLEADLRLSENYTDEDRDIFLFEYGCYPVFICMID